MRLLRACTLFSLWGAVAAATADASRNHHVHSVPQEWLEPSPGTPAVQRVTANRTFHVEVSPAADARTAILCFHAAGGDAQSCLNLVGSLLPPGAGERYVLAGAQGHLNVWNVFDEASFAPDVLFAEQILEMLVDEYEVKEVILWGFSNGAGLVHRVLLESDSPVIVGGIAVVTQPLRAMYDDAARTFMRQTGRELTPPFDAAFNVSAAPVVPRAVVVVLAQNDTVVANEYGHAMLPDGGR